MTEKANAGDELEVWKKPVIKEPFSPVMDKLFPFAVTFEIKYMLEPEPIP
jgi:hypothetical protein